MRSIVLTLASIAVLASAQTRDWANGTPGPRQVHQQITYDEHAKRVLLFGGNGPDGVLGGLWAFDGRAWSLLSPDGPPPRESGVMVYDSRRKRTILFGGRGARNKPLSDTWEWDGARWRSVDSSGPTPGVHSVAAYDRKRGILVLFGPVFARGHMPRPLPNETWVWNGATWKLIPASGAADCIPVGIAFDSTRQTLLLIAAKLAPAFSKEQWGLTESWEWTGESWRPGAIPPPRVAPAEANIAGFDNGIVLF